MPFKLVELLINRVRINHSRPVFIQWRHISLKFEGCIMNLETVAGLKIASDLWNFYYPTNILIKVTFGIWMLYFIFGHIMCADKYVEFNGNLMNQNC